MINPEKHQEPERPADCMLDCLPPAERRRAILGDDVIAYIHARVAEAPEPSDELVETLRRIMTRPAGASPPHPSPEPLCRRFTFAEAEAAFGADCMDTVRRKRRKPAPEDLLCGKRLINLFGEPSPAEPEA